MPEFKVSPLPVVDPDLDVTDRIAIVKAQDAFHREQLVRAEEIKVLRDKLKWCYYRETVNHAQNCRELRVQYLDLLATLKQGWVPFKLPSSAGAPDEGSHH
ncbi:hypothetical protein BJ742DRAFT_772263 [Cladochytrium replicatum]|nr:hypothetical protein BJ742DRAFT_772263 [Cladochytrium replicatum]